MHDGTMVWILPINTVFLRMVDAKTLDIYKVPYSMRKVPGSFTGEVLRDELIKHISGVKKVPGQSAFDSIESKLVEIRCKPAKLTVEQEYKMLTGKLEEYSQKKMWSKVSSISEEIQKMEEVTPSLKDLDTDKVQSTPSSDMSEFHLDVPPRPEYFKLATLQSVDEESKVIRMVVNSSNIPTVQVGDGCSVNLKGARLVQEKLGINCPFSRCNSHIASGAIRRGTAVSKKTAKPWDDIDSGVTQSKKKKTSSEKAKDALSTLAKNLRSVLCHFASSPKSSEMLNSALTALQMHEVHQLTWGSTRMCGFIYASLQCSEILVPFLDTITSAHLKPEESSYLLRPPGLLVLQLLADIHKVLVASYLRKVDEDEDGTLICEAYRIGMEAAESTISCDTNRANDFIQSLSLDEHDNVHATFTIDETSHHVILSKRLSGRFESLQKVKDQLVELKSDNLKFLSDQFIDQHEDHSLGWLMSAFDLEYKEDLSDRLEKISQLYNLFGVRKEHEIDELWFDYMVILIHEPRLSCTESQLSKEFEDAYCHMNVLSQELRSEKSTISNQREAWKKFYSTSMMSPKHVQAVGDNVLGCSQYKLG